MEIFSRQDIDALKNQKIQEMIQLLDIKTSKEKFTTELEGIRAEIAKERSVLASLKQQSSVTTPALDLVTRKKDTDTGDITRDHSREQNREHRDHRELGREHSRDQSRYCPVETSLPSLTPAVSRTVPGKLRDSSVYAGRPDYYRHMFDPSAAKVSRLCDGKNRDFTTGIFGGGLAGHGHQSHLPHHHPAMLPHHYLGPHSQPVNLSRVMEPELADKARLPPAMSLQQMQPIYKVGPAGPHQAGPHHDTQRPIPPPPPPYTLHGPIPYPPKTSEYFFARPEHLYHQQTKRPPVLPPPSTEQESKCESCLAPANFMCSACKLVHYCSAACQVSQHHNKEQLKYLLIFLLFSQKGHWTVHGRSCRKC